MYDKTIDKINNTDHNNGLYHRFNDAIFISAKNSNGIDSLINKIKALVRTDFIKDIFHLSYKQTNLLDTIYALTHVLKKKEDYNGIYLEVEGSKKSVDKIRQILKK